MSSNDVQPEGLTQTMNTNINNQDVTKESFATTSADNDKSSLPKVEHAQEFHQSATSDINKVEDPSTPDFKATTTESTTDANKHSPEISTHESTTSSSSQVQPTAAIETSTTATNKHTPTMSTHDPESSSPTDVKPTDTSETSTSQIPDLDSNKQSTSVSTEDHRNSLPTESQPVVTPEPSTSHIPDSNINKQSSTVSTEDHGNSLPNKSQPAITTEPSTFEIPHSDVNKQATMVSTEDHGNSLPPQTQKTTTSEPSTSQVPDNKQDTTVSSHDSPKSSTTKVATSNKEPDLVDQPNSIISNNEAKKDTSLTQVIKIIKLIWKKKKGKKHDSLKTKIGSVDLETNKDSLATKIESDDLETIKDSPATKIDSDDLEINKDSPTTKMNSDDLETNKENPTNDRNHLMNLIQEEIKFVKKTCPKLETHKSQITEEVKRASEMHNKLQAENGDLKEIKDLKRSVTKLKLQIPAKYRTYDDIDQQKKQKVFQDKRGLISAKLLKKLPRLHNQLFHVTPFCKTMQQRYNDLSLDLKLCLLCFSVFPENEEICRRLMVYWWIAEGLIPGEDDPGKTLEDHANEFFTELMDKDFIEPVSRSPERYVATCKMQPMIRAALVMISDKLKFFDFDEFGDPKDFGKFDEIESPEEMPDIHPLGDPREFFDFFNERRNEQREQIPIDKPIDILDSKGNPILFAPYQQNTDTVVDRNGDPIDTNKRHYFYRKKNITMKSYKACLMGTGLSKGLSWEKLHMLFNVKDDILEFKQEWFLKMKNVNILFLGRWQSSAAHHIEVEEFKFEESLEHMKHVRFFSLQGVSRVTELPESISRLESLLILDLRACHNLEKIPKTIGLLNHLTHLDMSECYLLKDIPKEISTLNSLQVLKGFVEVDSPEKHVCTLEDLGTLENLRKLSMYTHMKVFPTKSHLDALQKLEALRKLTILWGGHESKPLKNQTKEDNADNKKAKSPFILSKVIPPQKRVEGSIRRMHAFNSSTLGSRLEKLDLKCFPDKVTPTWLTPGNLKGLKKLYIRGGQFSDLGQYQDIYECGDSLNIPKETWNVKVLRLKYLDELKMEWTDLQNLFPEMTFLEKVKCPRLAMFPCNEHGVWKKPSTSG